MQNLIPCRFHVEVEAVLKSEGLRATKQRLDIWDELSSSDKHRDIETILVDLKKKKIQISRTVTEFDDFKIGDQVQHNLFGVGTILVLSGTGENQKVGVEFDGGLRKKLIVKYARLKKID